MQSKSAVVYKEVYRTGDFDTINFVARVAAE